MGSAVVPFGDGLRADLYYPLGPDGRPKPGKLPLVLWLHSYSYATGYSRYAAAPFDSLTRRGFAVLAFDQLGFGTRVLDARYFYEQYSKWSLMGKMVTDTRAAIDAVSALDVIDPSRIYVVGYGLGGKVGLLTAALDNRVKAIAALCGLDPLRSGYHRKGRRRYPSLLALARVDSTARIFYRRGIAAAVRLRPGFVADRSEAGTPHCSVSRPLRPGGRCEERGGTSQSYLSPARGRRAHWNWKRR